MLTTSRALGRLAPSPTGKLHLGNAWAFLCAWLGARSQKGSLILRIEDLDPQRSREEYVSALCEDLDWLGLDWDGAPLRQSARLGRYAGGLAELERQGLVYHCFCTRKELREMAGAPQAGVAFEPAYSGRCRFLGQDEARRRLAAGEHCSLRLYFPERARDGLLEIDDLVLGRVRLAPDEAGGDFPLRRSDGVFAYQLAVVLDDIDLGVSQVVRGADILTSTPRQRYLYELFGAEAPEYAHVPLLLDHEGERLAKRHASLSLAHMREAGVRPQELVGWLAFWSGLRGSAAPFTAAELLTGFDFRRISRKVARLPEKLGGIFPALAQPLACSGISSYYNAVEGKMESIYTLEWCRVVFPPERTNEFFEVLFGDPDDGAYDIELVFARQEGDMLEFSFQLRRRGNKCLACNLTYGLPKVFERHPIINCAGLAKAAAAASGRTLKEWKLGHTREESKALHRVPFYVWLE